MRPRDRRRQVHAAARAALSEVALAGDAAEIIEGLRQGADAEGLTVRDAADGVEGAALLVVACRVRPEQSAIAQAVQTVRALRDRMRPDAIVVVVAERGVARVAPDRLRALIGPELLFQIESALFAASGRSSWAWRTFRLRLVKASLRAVGITISRFTAV
jgi:hypothetical protein